MLNVKHYFIEISELALSFDCYFCLSDEIIVAEFEVLLNKIILCVLK